MEWSKEGLAKEVIMGKELSEAEKEEVLEMLMGVKKALSTGDHDIGTAKVKPHKIDIMNDTPI